MIGSRAVIGNKRDLDWMEKRFEDHVAKIQWAVWSPALLNRIDPKDFEEAQRFARSTHDRRLAGLYVNANADATTLVAPRHAVKKEHAISVLNLARTRLEFEFASGDRVLDGSDAHLKWFLDTINDDVGQKRLLSKGFLDKYQEFSGDTRAWIIWARQEFDKMATDEQTHLQRELTRVPSAPEASKPKWTIKVRVHTATHSIRPKVLNYWNERVGWVKLLSTGKKTELLLELRFADSIPAHNIFDAGLTGSKLCIAALNMGSLGFFWYELPRQGVRYFESVRDIDAPKMDVDIARPGPRIEWRRGALTEKNLRHAIECMAAFGPMSDQDASPIFGPYLQGLTFLSKSDIHLSCENSARDAFIQTLRAACRYFGDWDGRQETFIPSLHRVFEGIVPEDENRKLIFKILIPPHHTADGPYADALSAKRVADLYLVLVADRLVWERSRQNPSTPASS